MRIAICEDESVWAEKIVAFVKKWAKQNAFSIVVHHYPNGESFLHEHREIPYDLVVLDIEMGKMSGMDVAQSLRETDQTVFLFFLTSFPDFVYQGYDVDALAYVLKENLAVRLPKALDKFHCLWRTRQSEVITLSDEPGDVVLPLFEIFYIKINDHQAEFHTTSKIYKDRRALDEIERLLPAFFVRCHRSFIVNTRQLQSIQPDGCMLADGTAIPVSRRQYKNLVRAFAAPLGG